MFTPWLRAACLPACTHAPPACQHIRRLFQNVHNSELRQHVLRGEILPVVLVGMTSDELASQVRGRCKGGRGSDNTRMRPSPLACCWHRWCCRFALGSAWARMRHRCSTGSC